MQTKLLNEIVKEIAGENAVGVMDIIFGKRDVNEFLIAKKMKMTINQIRNIFYKMANFGLVSFTRKKDKRKGWYTYFWTLETYRALELLEKRIEKEIENLKNHLRNRETKRFYSCKTCKTEVGEEQALLHNFACQECGEIYELSQDEKTIALLKSRIERLERQRAEVAQEIAILQAENEKKFKKPEKKKVGKNKHSGKVSKSHPTKSLVAKKVKKKRR
jgi:transcription factor E